MSSIKPIDFQVVSSRVVADLTKNNPVPQEFLRNYLESRPNILSDGFCDIFQRNCRSENQKWSDFSLFKDSAIARLLVFPFWLELFEAAGCRENIGICIDWLKTSFPDKVAIIIQWNHDRDAATVPELQNLPDNFFVLNFNTSRPTSNDILLPFWTINTDPPGSDIVPTHLAGFVGNGRPALRQQLQKAVRCDSAFFWVEERVDEYNYFVMMRDSKFSLCPRGGGLSSYRLYESIQAERPPVIIGDDAVLPYPELRWDAFSIRVPEQFLEIDPYKLCTHLKWSLTMLDWERMHAYCRSVRSRFSLWGVQMEIHHRISEFLK